MCGILTVLTPFPTAVNDLLTVWLMPTRGVGPVTPYHERLPTILRRSRIFLLDSNERVCRPVFGLVSKPVRRPSAAEAFAGCDVNVATASGGPRTG